MTKKFRKPIAFLMALVMVMGMTFSDGCALFDSYVFADEITAVQPTKGDGSTENPYQIATYANLIWFQQYVDAGNYSANAELTDYITANEDLLNSSGELKGTPKYTWTTICKGGTSSYTGTFNGNGYSIRGLYTTSTKDNTALFGNLNGKIKNLQITDSYFNGSYNVSSFAGYIGLGTIENCSSNATIVGRYYCGGIAGKGSGTISNCYYAGNITTSSPTYSNAIVSEYSNSGTLINCYYLDTCGLTSTRAISKTADEFKSGEVCYTLNDSVTDGTQAWYQSIGTDAYPMLIKTSTATVYKAYDAEKDTYNYTNTQYSCADSGHKYKKGICAICGDCQEPELKNSVYQIANYGNLVWLQKYIDAGNYSVDAQLVDHIAANDNLLTVGGEVNGTPTYVWTPIAQSSSYSGTFNGNGYTISGLYNNAGQRYTGLFGKSSGMIKNLQITDSYFSGGYNTATFVGSVYSGTIENCSSTATIKGNSYCGGIAGESAGTISNCYYAGTITVSSTTDSNAIVSDYRNRGTVENCYYLDTCGLTSTRATSVTADKFSTGEICYLLNNGVISGQQAWYQTVDTDAYPMLIKTSTATVYRLYDEVDDKYEYSNSSCAEHTYVNGICKVCSINQMPKLKNNIYQIGNYGNLVWLQEYIDAGNYSVNAELTDHITANENLLNSNGEINGTPKYIWTAVCQSTNISNHIYKGTFNGNGYSISGLYNGNGKDYTGLFGHFKGTIKNLQVLDSYFNGGSNSGTFVGYSSGGTIENCSSTATIKGNFYCGGIAGQFFGTVKNCYYAGIITVTNSTYSNAIISDNYNRGTLTNCYYLDTCGLASTRATSVTAKKFGTGEICYLLNDGVEDGTQAWYQTIDTDAYPMLAKTSGGTVYKYLDDSGNAIYTNTLPECDEHNFVNGICTECYTYQEPELKAGVYQIDNYGNLVWLQKYIDAGNYSVNAELTDHIAANENLLNSSGEINGTPKYTWTPICQGGSEIGYKGTFNGNGYTISGLYNDSGKDNTGLFGEFKGTIKNLQITDSYFSGGDKTGTFVGCDNGGIIENCSSTATVKGSFYCGGIAGDSIGTIKNSYYGGIIVSDTETSNAIVSEYQNYGVIKNCYYLDTCGLTSVKAMKKTADEFKSGEVCYLVNNKVTDGTQNWYQTINTDAYPMLIKTSTATVYKAYNETEAKSYYTNTEYICTHNYVNGICSICDVLQEPEFENDVYQIANYGNLVWLQEYIDAGNYTVDAELIDHIVVNEGLLNSSGEVNSTPKYIWTPICSDIKSDNIDSIYTGTINGNGYSISGLYNVGTNYVGLFSVLNGTIKNLQIVDSYFSGVDDVGTFAGISYLNGTVENCSSTATIKVEGISGGIIGGNMGAIKNSYYAGTIIADSEYSDAIASSVDNDYGVVTNCYYLDTCGLTSATATSKTAEEFKSGEVCYILNNGVTNGTQTWYQNLTKDSYPVLSGYTVLYKDAVIKYYNSGSGDVNLDKTINNTDAALILKYINGRTTFEDYQISIADANKNGVVDILDVILILAE